MEPKPRLFIYDRKELGVLVLLGVMVAIFAFTLGIHLGKRVNLKGPGSQTAETAAIETVQDKVPSRQELGEQGKGADQAAEESLNTALHDEVAKTGIKLETPRQIELPDQTKAEASAEHKTPAPAAAAHAEDESAHAEEAHAEAKHAEPAAQGDEHSDAPAKHAEAKAAATSHSDDDDEAAPAPQQSRRKSAAPKVVQGARGARGGKYTLQIGSFPVAAEARERINVIEGLGLKAVMKEADVRGKGHWYRVYVGNFASKGEAAEAGTKYRSQRMIDSFIVARVTE